MKGAIALCGLLLLTGPPVARAHIRPNSLHYQGSLTGPGGLPVADESRSMTFRIWDAEVGGTVLWSENQSVTTRDGIYNVRLGIVTPLSAEFTRTRWLGIQVGQDPEQVPRVALSPTTYQYNADMVDGIHVHGDSQTWSGAGYQEGLGRMTRFQIPGDSGPADLYLPLVHFYPFRIVLTCPHAAPKTGDVACADCVENDEVVSCLGIDGSGAPIRKSLRLDSGDQILSVRGGHVTLGCPGDGSRRFRVHTEGEWVLGYIIY